MARSSTATWVGGAACGRLVNLCKKDSSLPELMSRGHIPRRIIRNLLQLCFLSNAWNKGPFKAVPHNLESCVLLISSSNFEVSCGRSFAVMRSGKKKGGFNFFVEREVFGRFAEFFH